MKQCSFSECKNKAEIHIGFGLCKGEVSMCKECYKDYENHLNARENMLKDNLQIEICKVIKNLRF